MPTATAKVVDASAVAALIFDEPAAWNILLQFTGARLIAPALIEFELANVCIMKLRRGQASLPDLLASFALRKDLGIEFLPVDAVGTVELAASTGLSGYDASYLWLARRHEVELVTLDKRLAAAAAA